MMDIYFLSNMFRNIISTFFHEAIWVVAFFFLLNKTFVNVKLLSISKIVAAGTLGLLLLFSIVHSI
ncbi:MULTISPECIES: hypothetical protein [unclassified Bacillus (in: firmicutes)]|uniref:hypothetical protein n=1 Tax=unclassified Bacillus (in: firmicutes) TaxID=185979 RepID=UPI0008E79B11|nr:MULTISPECIES: hypothetical protein [unclassified Bacillus (in: firmicutes)]SFB04427.1 hypothetical protein SAMN02799634_104295 [Bacillus sp. UNCCL13]SFQ88507.1 hypothetical protein SAMN04488577_3219 [Bacillus sp. cl95]